MRIRYTVIDHKTNTKHTYTSLGWQLGFTLVYILGIGVGYLLNYWL
jgi:hypothetical protein